MCVDMHVMCLDIVLVCSKYTVHGNNSNNGINAMDYTDTYYCLYTCTNLSTLQRCSALLIMYNLMIFL